jgi:hypothetical protein
MPYGRIEKFNSVVEQTQYNLTGHLARPLRWIVSKISALLRELNFFQYCLKFGQRNDDIYVCTYLKSGTTLMQMILYQLTTNGEVDFEHIYDVSPWIRNDAFKGKPPLNFPSPRIIKSHDGYDQFEMDIKGRFIHVTRNGKDVAASLYHQNKNYNRADLEFSETFQNFFERKSKMNWFSYTRDWFENKKKLNVLYVKYEDLIDRKEEVIREVAKFINIELTHEIVERTLERSSFDFMKLHEDKFGEQPLERVYNQFIRKGKKGEGEEYLNEAQKKFFQEQYDKHLASLIK